MTTQQANFLRQLDIISPADLPWPVNVIGLGGIGSAALLPLMNLGFTRFILWDDDLVAPHNLPNQPLYRPQDIGYIKVEKAAQVLRDYEVSGVTSHTRRLSKADRLKGIVVGAVDSMTSRKIIWRVLKKSRASVPLYLDGRLGGEQLQLHTVRLGKTAEIRRYEKNFLFSDEEGAALPCTAQSVGYTGQVLAGYICNNITRWVRREPFYAFLDHNLPSMRLTPGSLIEPSPEEQAS